MRTNSNKLILPDVIYIPVGQGTPLAAGRRLYFTVLTEQVVVVAGLEGGCEANELASCLKASKLCTEFIIAISTFSNRIMRLVQHFGHRG
jgi:hypothetical protein